MCFQMHNKSFRAEVFYYLGEKLPLSQNQITSHKENWLGSSFHKGDPLPASSQVVSEYM